MPRGTVVVLRSSINMNTEKPQTSEQAGMWLELFRSAQPNFTLHAQELRMSNFFTCHPWVVGATAETCSPVSLESC